MADRLENIPQVGQCIFEVGSMHQDIIQIDDTTGTGNARQDPLHQALKGGWSIAEAKWHDPKLPQSLADGESSLGPSFRRQFHLPVATPEVKRTEPA